MTTATDQLLDLYTEYQKIRNKRLALNAKQAGYEQQEKDLHARILKAGRLQNGGQRQFSNGKIFTVKRTDVPEATITRKGYTRYTFGVE
jgi:hypothetical protein